MNHVEFKASFMAINRCMSSIYGAYRNSYHSFQNLLCFMSHHQIATKHTSGKSHHT